MPYIYVTVPIILLNTTIAPTMKKVSDSYHQKRTLYGKICVVPTPLLAYTSICLKTTVSPTTPVRTTHVAFFCIKEITALLTIILLRTMNAEFTYGKVAITALKTIIAPTM